MLHAFTNSPITSFNFANRTFYVKRDDLLDPRFSGNKARKLAYFLAGNHQDLNEINTVVSYGGNQSNLMYALSSLARLKEWNFIYYTPKLSSLAKNSVTGNLKASLAKGMQLMEVEEDFNLFSNNLLALFTQSPDKNEEASLTIKPLVKANQLLITQGGAQQEAEFGIKILAHEIETWANENNLPELAIFIASGTGTTAYYLQKNLSPQFKVYTTNCVGSAEYLLKQFFNLQTDNSTTLLPHILENSKFRFATPYQELYQTISSINEASQIEFDLVYDPVGWYILLSNISRISAPILYLHCGGTLGNQTMLNRYRYKGLL